MSCRSASPARRPAAPIPTRLGRPADTEVDPATNEIYVADGYGNHRVIVFDAETGAYKRHWGAYGKAAERRQEAGPTTRQRRSPSSSPIRSTACSSSNDGLVYVCDRTNDRIQVFRKDGTFVKEFFVAEETLQQRLGLGSRSLAEDAQQTFHASSPTAQTTKYARWCARPERTSGPSAQRPQRRQFHWIHNLASGQQGQHLHDGSRYRESARRNSAILGTAAEVTCCLSPPRSARARRYR